MSKALVTIGSITSHGGIVAECDTTFIINGIAVHLNGMKHFCPQCKTVVSAIASDQTTIVNGRAVVLAGDKTTCGATFLGNQSLVVAQPKSSSSASSAISKLNIAQSPITKAASNVPNMTMGLTKQSDKPKGPFTGGGHGDPDNTRGVLNNLTFGISEKVLTALGMKPADPKKLEEGEIVGAVIGPGKVKAIGKAAKEVGGKVLGKEATGVLGSRHNQMNQPKNPSYQPVRNNPTNIDGRNYSGHALDRMQDRGIMPSVVKDTIKNGSQTVGTKSTTNHYSPANNVTVVTNKRGDVVTVSHGKIDGKGK